MNTSLVNELIDNVKSYQTNNEINLIHKKAILSCNIVFKINNIYRRKFYLIQMVFQFHSTI